MAIPLHHPVTGGRYEAVTETQAELMVSNGWVRDEPGAVTAPDAPFDIATATVEELRDYAHTNSIDLGGATRKADIIEAIQTAPLNTEES